MLHFPPESFFHLAGLQHLEDITFPSQNRERIYKEILNKNLTIEDINTSVFYKESYLEERLNDFRFLKDMIETNLNLKMNVRDVPYLQNIGMITQMVHLKRQHC